MKQVKTEREIYLSKLKLKKYSILAIQIGLLALLILLWEICANIGIIDSFITSQPSRVVKTIINLSSNDLLMHRKIHLHQEYNNYPPCQQSK